MSIDLDLTDLRELLDGADVPSSTYSLGAETEGAWCVVPVPAAPATNGQSFAPEPDDQLPRPTWRVYRLVDGVRHDLTEVSTEEGACDVLLGELGFGYLVPGLR